MTNERLGVIEHTLQQLVAGQAQIIGRLDASDRRFDRIEGRLDKIDSRLDGLDEKVHLLAEAQETAQEVMIKGFDDLGDELDRRLSPVEAAVRQLSATAPDRSRRPAAPSSRKRTPRR